jgi:enoyl-CoA hydratase/carnithine racemase
VNFETLTYQTADGILTLTLRRPERMNAFNPIMRQELIQAFELADEDDEVRAVIVTGDGKAFCAGADLASGGDAFNRDKRQDAGLAGTVRDGGGTVTLRIYDCKKPVIAAINGAAVGVGVTMTLPMDIRLASTKAKFGFVFARRGITMEACSSWFLPRLVGMQQAAEWVFSGRVFDAQEALQGGLVRSLHEPDELLPAAQRLAREIADNVSPVATALNRQLMWRMLGADHPMEAHKIDSRTIAYMGQTADVKEGVGAFLEKRPARFALRPSQDMPDFYPWWVEREYE